MRQSSWDEVPNVAIYTDNEQKNKYLWLIWHANRSYKRTTLSDRSLCVQISSDKLEEKSFHQKKSRKKSSFFVVQDGLSYPVSFGSINCAKSCRSQLQEQRLVRLTDNYCLFRCVGKEILDLIANWIREYCSKFMKSVNFGFLPLHYFYFTH